MQRGQRFAVVRSGSTAGKWVVEATSEARVRESGADIALVANSRRQAQDEADRLNAIEADPASTRHLRRDDEVFFDD